MNVLINLRSFRGGAPLSMREYQRVLMDEGHHVCVCGEMETGCEQENIYLKDTPCYHVDTCKESSLHSIISTAISLFQVMKKTDTDMLLSVSRTNFGVCRAVCQATGVAFLPVIPGGSISNTAKNLMAVRTAKVICFSFENKEGLINNGLDEKNIHVISNRVRVDPDNMWREYYLDRDKNEPIKMLLISRLDPEHMAGICSFMDRVATYGGKAVLSIAGDGICATECQAYADQINKKRKVVTLLGYRKDVNDLALQSDVIIGKGRSVITPVMMNRIGFVLGYDGGLSVCDEDTFDSLYKNNFSGRGAAQLLDNEQFIALCEKIRTDPSVLDRFGRVSEMVRNAYSVDVLPDKLMPIIAELVSEGMKPKYGLRQEIRTIVNAIMVHCRWIVRAIILKMKGQ